MVALPSSGRPNLVIAPAVKSIASASWVLPEPPWPTIAIVLNRPISSTAISVNLDESFYRATHLGAFPLRDYPLLRRRPDHLEITTSAEGSLSHSYSPNIITSAKETSPIFTPLPFRERGRGLGRPYWARPLTLIVGSFDTHVTCKYPDRSPGGFEQQRSVRIDSLDHACDPRARIHHYDASAGQRRKMLPQRANHPETLSLCLHIAGVQPFKKRSGKSNSIASPARRDQHRGRLVPQLRRHLLAREVQVESDSQQHALKPLAAIRHRLGDNSPRLPPDEPASQSAWNLFIITPLPFRKEVRG